MQMRKNEEKQVNSLNDRKDNHGNPAAPDANEEAKGKDEPPKPSVLVPHEVSVAFDDQRPLGKRETETGQGAVACRDRVAETHEKHKANLWEGWSICCCYRTRLTQLKRKAVRNAVKKTKSLPRRVMSSSPSQSSRGEFLLDRRGAGSSLWSSTSPASSFSFNCSACSRWKVAIRKDQQFPACS